VAPLPVDQILHATYQNIADGYLDLRRVLDLSLLLPRLSPAETMMLPTWPATPASRGDWRFHFIW